MTNVGDVGCGPKAVATWGPSWAADMDTDAGTAHTGQTLQLPIKET